MSNKNLDFEEELDYEVDEIAEQFGDKISNQVKKSVSNSYGKKNHKEKKFKKDGFYDSNRK